MVDNRWWACRAPFFSPVLSKAVLGVQDFLLGKDRGLASQLRPHKVFNRPTSETLLIQGYPSENVTTRWQPLQIPLFLELF